MRAFVHRLVDRAIARLFPRLLRGWWEWQLARVQKDHDESARCVFCGARNPFHEDHCSSRYAVDA
jgi:hypothetical protein